MPVDEGRRFLPVLAQVDAIMRRRRTEWAHLGTPGHGRTLGLPSKIRVPREKNAKGKTWAMAMPFRCR